MNNSGKSKLTKGLVLFALMVAIVVACLYLNTATKAVPSHKESHDFSVENALGHLRKIAAEPHPMGTEEHLMVRDYIINELQMAGIEPELQLTEVFYPESNIAATVGNIIVKIPGTEGGKSILVSSHYDSVADSYGASDDGAAVAVMLEVLRIIQLGESFKNDIILLFTDGEEMGLLGAKAFVDKHPLASKVGLVLNFESRGTGGQSLMFETSSENKWLISEFAKAAPFPIANSITYEIYRHMPNDTDFTPFRKMGCMGLNFAYIDNVFDYHTGGDNVENTSIESIQHHGSYAVSLIRHFGNSNLKNPQKSNAVYFNTIAYGFVHYSYSWIFPLVVLTCLILMFVLIIGFKKKIIHPIRLLFGFIAFLIHGILAPSIAILIYYILIRYYPGADVRLLNFNQKYILTGLAGLSVGISFLFYKLLMSGIKIWHLILFLAVAISLFAWSSLISWPIVIAIIALSVILYLLYRKPVSVWELSAGSFIGWAAIMIIASLKLPGASFLFTWPLVFSLIPVAIYFLKSYGKYYTVAQIAMMLLFALPVLIWFPDYAFKFSLALGLKLSGGAIFFVTLGLSLLIVHIDIITRVKSWAVPLVLFSGGLVFLLYGAINTGYDQRHKKLNSLVFATNGNTKESFFTSFENDTDEWKIKYLTNEPDSSILDDFFAWSDWNRPVKPVEAISLPSPQLNILKDSLFDNQRLLEVHLNSGRKADNLYIQIKTESDSLKARINSSNWKNLKRFNDTDWFLIRYFAFPEDGINFNMLLNKDEQAEFRLTDIVYGLDEISELEIDKRPDYMMSQGDRSLSTRKFNF